MGEGSPLLFLSILSGGVIRKGWSHAWAEKLQMIFPLGLADLFHHRPWLDIESSDEESWSGARPT